GEGDVRKGRTLVIQGSRRIVTLTAAPRSLAASASASGLVGIVCAVSGASGEHRVALTASVCAGAFVAFSAAAVTAFVSSRAMARGPQAVWQTSLVMSVVKMAFIGACLVAASRCGWFRAAPFVIALSSIYLATGVCVALSQNRAMLVRSAPGAPNQ
ncbi:MAG: hypothetical protein ACRD1Z_06440, partial [Vicinamibacteria bacterium]